MFEPGGVLGYNGRDSFYNLINAIVQRGYTTLENQTWLTAAPSNAEGARASFGALLSLLYLRPFALTGNIDAALGAVQRDLYAHWQADNALTAEQRVEGQAYFTTNYLNSRAALDLHLIYYNGANARYDLTDTLVWIILRAPPSHFGGPG